MFESLKKKFSRTSEQLEEELKEEAMQEDNFQEESGKRFSFFSFGRKKEEEDVDESTLLPEAEEDEEEIIEDTPEIEEPEEDSEVTEEKKSRFWSRNKDKDEEDSEGDEDSDEESEEKKSHFWSRNKNKEDISADGEASGGLFSFVREKTIQEKHVEDVLWDLEMGLLEGDVAMEVATEVVESVKNNLVGKKIKRSNDITELT